VEQRSSLDLARVLGDLAVQMQADGADTATLLRTVVTASVDILNGISWAGVALIRGANVTSAAPTDDVARSLDELQSRLGEGPAISAVGDDASLIIPDLGQELRWPGFVEEAVRLGVQCLMSFRLFVEAGDVGVLTLYGPHPNYFTDDDLAVGEILARHAAVAMAGAAAQEQLQRAVASRDLIGQAKGILMHRDRLTGLQAFGALVRASQETNIKLTEVANVLVTDFEASLTT
jgi:GAF domain-containing protein